MRIERVSQANNLDFMRLCFAVLVIASHSFPLTRGSDSAEPLSRWSHGQISFGGVAVDAFFIISGFLITSSAERSPELGRFVRKRVARIYPAFLCCALLTALVVMPMASATLSNQSPAAQVADTVLQTLRLREFKYVGAFQHNPFPGEINGSIWSIQYEFWCYLGVALLMVSNLLRRRSLILVLFVASVAVSCASSLMRWHPRGSVVFSIFGLPDFWARLMPLYLAGMVFYLYRDRIAYTWRGFLLASVASLSSLFLPGAWALVFPIAGCYALFHLAYVPKGTLNRFGRFGDLSYGTYLFAFPIQQILVQRLHGLSPLLLFFYATPLTMLLAALSWYCIERHFLHPGKLVRAG